MLKRGIGISLAPLFAGFASICQAYWDPPTISPDAPTANTTVSVVITGGICDALIDVPSYPQITRNGSAIRVLMRTIHQTSSELCFLPVLSVPVEIGSFEAGTYTLTVDVLYYDIFGMHVDTLGVLPVNVSGSPSGDPLGAPALSDFGLLTLAIALIAAVRFSLRVPHEGDKIVRIT